MSKEEDADFDQEFALGINAEWQGRSAFQVEQKSPLSYCSSIKVFHQLIFF